MIAVTVEKRYGAATARVRVTATSIERAFRLAGEDARVVFPTDAGLIFAAGDASGSTEGLSPFGNEEVMAA